MQTGNFEFLTGNLFLLLWILSAWAALNQLTRGRARKLASGTKDKKFAEKLEKWLENRDSYRIVFHILSISVFTLVILALINLVKIYFPDKSNDSLILYTLCASVIIIILSELIAKIIAIYLDLFLLKITMPVVYLFNVTILSPVILIYKLIQVKFEEWHQPDNEEEKVTTKDEIMSWVEKKENDEEDDKALEEEEKQMIRGIFDLDETSVREIMTPRVDIKAISLDAAIEDVKKMFIESGHSRIPVYDKNIDEIKGVLYAKDFLDEKKLKSASLTELAHKPFFIPETKAVDELLQELRKTRNHFAVVIDEYGGTAGVVTLEDILEEIVGEIQDEYDTADDGQHDPVPTPDNGYIIDGRMLISDVNELLDINISEDEDVDTIGGLVCGKLGKIPLPGEETTIDDNIYLKVLKADRRKIISLKIKLLNTDD